MPERSVGGLSIGSPGTLYAYKRLWETFGSNEDIISWSDLFTDAINIGQNGFKMYETFYNDIISQLPYLSRYNSTCKLLLNYPYCNQSKYNIGDIVYNKDLSNTFKILSSMTPNQAINDFYNGTIATHIINTIQSAYNNITGRTGLLTRHDLSTYRAVFREPISNTIELNDQEYDIYGMNMPSSGPLTVQYELKLLQHLLKDNDNNLDLKLLSTNRYSSDTLHYLFSIGNIAFADRNQYMADQDFVNVPINGLQNDNYLRERAKTFLNNAAQDMPIPYGRPNGWNNTYKQSSSIEHGTAHICIVDRFGNVISITTTIEYTFGARVVVDGYGFFLNNELTDFSSKGMINDSQVANGAEGGKRKRISAINLFNYNDNETYGGKRPRSSMSPTIILKDNKPYLAIGGRGGKNIISNVFNIIVRHLLYDINIQRAINDARIYSFNLDGQLRFEKTLWEQINGNITNRMVNKFGYKMDNLLDYSFGSCNSIVIDNRNDFNMLYCGVDNNRRPMEGCSAVCNSTDSYCPFAITTLYPQTTTDMNDICDKNNEYKWIIKVELRLLLLVDPNENDNRILIQNSLKRVFFNSIYKSLQMKWLDEFCYDLMDKQLIIHSIDPQDYEINAGFQYNNDLQNKVFSNDTLFYTFNNIFNQELIDILIENKIIENDNNMDVKINTPSKYVTPSHNNKDHTIEGSLINIIVIISLINIIISIAIIVYVFRKTKKRVDIEGDISWIDARKKYNYKLPYFVVLIEIIASIIYWIFAIVVITYESYLGWILVGLLLIAEIILYTRYMLYKQLILYQIPQILKQDNIDLQIKQNEIIARRIDVGVFGILLSTMEDIPIIIVVIIIGEKFGYNGIEIISLIIALISICMKIILLGYAKYGKVELYDINENEQDLLVNSQKQTKEAIELRDDMNDENSLHNINENDHDEFVNDQQQTKDAIDLRNEFVNNQQQIKEAIGLEDEDDMNDENALFSNDIIEKQFD